MFMRYRILLMTAALGGTNCHGDGTEDDTSVDSDQQLIDLCTKNCLKPLCSGSIDVSPDYESVCDSRCEMRVDVSESDGCSREYEELLTCLEEASCVDYYLWYTQADLAPCAGLEAEFVSLCPSIELRDEG